MNTKSFSYSRKLSIGRLTSSGRRKKYASGGDVSASCLRWISAGKLMDLSDAIRDSGRSVHSHSNQGQNLIVQKIKPHGPTHFDRPQNQEIVSQFLDVEHHARQGGAVCWTVSTDNQGIDIMAVPRHKCLQAVEDSIEKRGVASIAPKDYDYGVSWDSAREAVRSGVGDLSHPEITAHPEVQPHPSSRVQPAGARAHHYSGGSLTITHENSLREEYLQELPEATVNAISQQLRLMNVLKDTQLVLSGMMDIVAERTFPAAQWLRTSRYRPKSFQGQCWYKLAPADQSALLGSTRWCVAECQFFPTTRSYAPLEVEQCVPAGGGGIASRYTLNPAIHPNFVSVEGRVFGTSSYH